MRDSALLGLALLLVTGSAGADVTLTLERPEPYELQVRGFELTRQAEVDIEATGRWDRDDGGWIGRLFHGDDEEEMLSVYAWILDTATREPVWIMLGDETDYVSSTLRKAEDSLRLEPGQYELYFYSGYRWLEELEQRDRSNVSEDDPEEDGGWWDRLFRHDRFNPGDLREDLADCHVTLSVRGLQRDDVRSFEVTGGLPGALIRHNRLGDSSFEFSGFELDRPQELRVYALVEQPREDREPADYGWILDADTREVVWHPTRQGARPAGGGNKNRLLDEKIELEAGRYIVYAGTDDTHSYGGFNVNPPHDPLNWGITLLPGDGFDPDAYRTYSPAQQLPVIEAVRVGSYENVERRVGRVLRAARGVRRPRLDHGCHERRDGVGDDRTQHDGRRRSREEPSLRRLGRSARRNVRPALRDRRFPRSRRLERGNPLRVRCLGCPAVGRPGCRNLPTSESRPGFRIRGAVEAGRPCLEARGPEPPRRS